MLQITFLPFHRPLISISRWYTSNPLCDQLSSLLAVLYVSTSFIRPYKMDDANALYRLDIARPALKLYHIIEVLLHLLGVVPGIKTNNILVRRYRLLRTDTIYTDEFIADGFYRLDLFVCACICAECLFGISAMSIESFYENQHTSRGIRLVYTTLVIMERLSRSSQNIQLLRIFRNTTLFQSTDSILRGIYLVLKHYGLWLFIAIIICLFSFSYVLHHFYGDAKQAQGGLYNPWSTFSGSLDKLGQLFFVDNWPDVHREMMALNLPCATAICVVIVFFFNMVFANIFIGAMITSIGSVQKDYMNRRTIEKMIIHHGKMETLHKLTSKEIERVNKQRQNREMAEKANFMAFFSEADKKFDDGNATVTVENEESLANKSFVTVLRMYIDCNDKLEELTNEYMRDLVMEMCI
ncbi:hypothetical protein GJ496_005188 [Pomphorhynchus laevis]|nr:hypothetical protein GJ496_005188 [Pomphorhynchus laevis]